MKRAPVKQTAGGRVPLPDVFPGEFFVLERVRDDESYVLHLDDDQHSTFNLGDDFEQIRGVFTSRGYPSDKVCDLVDRAREFGMCQYIPSGLEAVEDRVIQILPRNARNPVPNIFQQASNGWNYL